MGLIMLVASFFIWWYGRGWQQVAQGIKPRLNQVLYSFSVIQLLRTLFAPWRRIITYPGSSIGEKLHALGDNVVSRTIGFFVRLVVLFSAVLTLIAVSLFSALELILWPLLPPAIPILIIMGIV